MDFWVDFSGILAFIAGFLACRAHIWLVGREASSRLNAYNASKGRVAKAEYSDRMSGAIADALILFKEGKKPVDILKELLPKYPDVAVQLGKKLGGKGLEGLI